MLTADLMAIGKRMWLDCWYEDWIKYADSGLLGNIAWSHTRRNLERLDHAEDTLKSVCLFGFAIS